MADSKYFLNNDILGSNVNPASERGIQPIGAADIRPPLHDARFLEAFPTMWANGYTFRRAVEANHQQDIGEWVSLFALRFFDILRVSTYEQAILGDPKSYDIDFWIAIHGTHPTRDLKFLRVLETRDQDPVTVGAFYPEIIFFPARGRADWAKSNSLRPFLEGERLSWTKVKQKFLITDEAKKKLHVQLRLVAGLLTGECRNALNGFCDTEFGAAPSLANESLTTGGASAENPANWERFVKVDTSPDKVDQTQMGLLQAYPLKKQPNEDGGTTYFLVSDMPIQSAWMSAQTPGSPAPNQFFKTGDNEITVKSGDNEIKCKLGGSDKILMLDKLFLTKPFHCSIPLAELQEFTAMAKTETHQIEGISQSSDERAICLAPFTHELVRNIPALLQKEGRVEIHNVLNHSVTWKVTILGKEVFWQVDYDGTKQSFHQETSLAMYPPRVSPKWKLYAVFGKGGEEYGRWEIIGEEGQKGDMIKLTDDTYISLLQPDSESRNRPRALRLNDEAGQERGILFLKDLEDAGTVTEAGADLAMDFGTSNTCLAFQTNEPKLLQFELIPIMLWGKTHIDTVGFVPMDWGGKRGFFPTILLSRKEDPDLENLKPDQVGLKHLFKVDIPCLHKNTEPIISGELDINWDMWPDLKWNASPNEPWRKLFFEQVLLFAHAELFFNHQTKIKKYIFTFPLAFSTEQRDLYHSQAKETIQRIQNYCYGQSWEGNESNYVDDIDESTAIASSINLGFNSQILDVFVDVGGGTADIAVRHNKTLYVLDSLRIAGQEFFKFSRRGLAKNLWGSDVFIKHLENLLDATDLKRRLDNLKSRGDKDAFDIFYSVAISHLKDEEFQAKEYTILEKKMGDKSYQRYRARLFFQHIIAYSLVQACATVLSNKLKLSSGLRLTLGGNAWGLMCFAEMKREKAGLLDEANKILDLMKQKLAGAGTEEENALLKPLTVFDINLLSAAKLSDAKTKVALGALTVEPKRKDEENTSPYIGVTLNKLMLNHLGPENLSWYERWDFELWRKKYTSYSFLQGVTDVNFEEPEDQTGAFDPILSVFTGLGNLHADARVDNMPGTEWANINALFGDEIRNSKGVKGSMSPVNYFLSFLLYQKKKQESFLDKLAEANNIKSN